MLQRTPHVQVFEERADGIGDVLHQLRAAEERAGFRRFPADVLKRCRRQVGNGTRLQQPELAGGERPLDVLGHSVEMALHLEPQGREPMESICAEGVLLPPSLIDILEPGAVAGRHHHPGLGANRGRNGGERSAVENMGIRIDLSADNGIAQTVAAVDDHLAPFAGGRVGGEQDAGYIRIDQSLDDDRHGDLALVDGHAVAVCHGACGPERHPAVLDGVDERIAALDAEVGILLSGEGQLRPVLHGCRGSHGHGPLAETRVRGADRVGNFRREDALGKETLYPGRRSVEGQDAPNDLGNGGIRQPRLKVVCLDKLRVRPSRDVESVRDREAGGAQNRQGPALAAEYFQRVGGGSQRQGERRHCIGLGRDPVFPQFPRSRKGSATSQLAATRTPGSPDSSA